MRRVVGAFVGVAVALGAWAIGQERTGAVRVSVVPDRADWSYAIGAPARFRVTVARDGHAPRRDAGQGRVRPRADAAASSRRPRRWPRTASRSTAAR